MKRNIARPSSRATSIRGFTLVELVVVIIITAILAAVAVPRFSSSMATQRLNAASNRIKADFSFAQQTAKYASATQTIQFFAATDSYDLPGIPDIDHPSQPYQVSMTEEPYGVDIVFAQFGTDEAVIFDGYGKADSGGTIALRVGRLLMSLELDANRGDARVKPLPAIIIDPNNLPGSTAALGQMRADAAVVVVPQ